MFLTGRYCLYVRKWNDLAQSDEVAKGVFMYLPLVYSKKAFIFAAWLSINNDKDIVGTTVFNFVKGFYEELLGIELRNEEVVAWFSEPWRLKDRITKISENLNLLRIALVQLDVAA